MAPEKIESIYVKNKLVQQVYVDGDSLENYLVAIVIPEPKEITNWYKGIKELISHGYLFPETIYLIVFLSSKLTVTMRNK